ncbi:MAG: alpha/beta hydrolase [Acidimicrobiia bacterium]|nr:alpha/beta hydrolase [Acidimicrobiia bacterium]
MTEFAEAVGTRIGYDTFGSGPDLVFLHAGIANRTMWQPQIDEFSDRFRITTPDARGFGDTPIGDEPFSRRDDLVAVFDAAGIASAAVVGCSIGAGFALDFAIEHPSRVDKLVLIGVTPPGFDGQDEPALEEAWPQIDALIEAGNLEEAGRMEARLWVDGPRRAQGSAPAWLTEKVVEWSIPINSVKEWGESRQLDPYAMFRLDQVSVPTLVIVGLEDAEVVLEGCRQTAAGIAGARLVELEGTAHLPNLEVPEALNRALGDFLT